MTLCRCPHCESTFQLSVPPDSDFWGHTWIDEDGFVPWVCIDCRKNGVSIAAKYGREDFVEAHVGPSIENH